MLADSGGNDFCVESLLMHRILRHVCKCPGQWSCLLMTPKSFKIVLVDEVCCGMRGWREREQQLGVLASMCVGKLET